MDEDDGEARRDGEVDALALAAFVFSIVSLVVPLVMTAVALVLARRSHRRIAEADDGRRGTQLATAAQVVSATWCALLVAAVATIVTLAALTGEDDDDTDRSDRIAVAPEAVLRAIRESPPYPLPYTGPPSRTPSTEPERALTFQGDARPSSIAFDPGAILHYSSNGSRLVITVVGKDEREEVARCDEPCDGTVEVGRFQRSEFYDLQIEADAGWYVRVEGAYDVVD